MTLVLPTGNIRQKLKVEVKSVLRIGSAHNNVRTSNVKIAQISNVVYITDLTSTLIFQLSVLVEERKRKEPAIAIIIYSFVL
jgi:hypothetical protein